MQQEPIELTPKPSRVLHRKTKMVSFRVSSDEYEKLRTFCVSKGQRSVSDLARLAVSTILDSGGAPNVESRLSDMEGRVHFLTREILRMAGPGMEPIAESGRRESASCHV